MGIHRLIIGYLVAGILGMFSGSALADSDDINPMLDKKYVVWLGGFFPTSIRLWILKIMMQS